MIGEILNNRYKIISLLGGGAMGEVYLPSDQQSGRQVAVKILARYLITNPGGDRYVMFQFLRRTFFIFPNG